MFRKSTSTTIGMGAALFALTLATSALAGEQYIDPTGYAISGYDVVSYYDLEQAPVGSAQPAPLIGNAGITVEYNGAVWAFSSEANRERFLADPEAFVPAYDGHCAYGVALDGKVPGNPLLWRIVDGELYLNITPTVVGFWEEDIDGFIQQSEINWDHLEANPASDNPVPNLDTSLAPAN